jgi:4-hydroxy-tetrahydrodipicolinate synthase
MTVGFTPGGVFTAIVTPFTADGRPDFAAFRKLARFQVAGGVDGIVPCGTTGESPTLAWEEHDALVAAVVEEVGDRVAVVAGTGSNNTAEAIEATESARKLGAHGALVVDCYYNGPSSLELRTDYYQRILDAVPDLPIVPYVIPGRSGCALSAADVAVLHLESPERVIAVKEATGDLARMRETRALAGASLGILSGDDDLTFAMMEDAAIGCAGVISVVSNVVPAEVVRMVRAAAAGDVEGAARARDRLAPFFRLVTYIEAAERRLPGGRAAKVQDKYRNPVPIKAVMAGLGMVGGATRPPLGRMSKSALEGCRAVLREAHAASPDLFAPIEEAFEVSVAARLADDEVWSALAR